MNGNRALSDAEWALAQDLFEPATGARGRPAVHDRRAMVDACCYVLRTGASWRSLPPGIYPPWQSVQKAFVKWAREGRFEQLQERLRQQWRQRLERAAQPSAAIIDSQSTRGSAQGGQLGYDAGKKVKGRKRHILTDTCGFLIFILVHAADIQDRDGAVDVLAAVRTRLPWLRHVFADGGDAGDKLRSALIGMGKWTIEIIKRSDRVKGFEVLPRRWGVERTFAWLGRCRRLAKDWERSIASSTAWALIASIRMLTRRAARYCWN